MSPPISPPEDARGIVLTSITCEGIDYLHRPLGPSLPPPPFPPLASLNLIVPHQVNVKAEQMSDETSC